MPAFLLILALTFGFSHANAGEITDLSIPQTGRFTSLLDLSNGTRDAVHGSDENSGYVAQSPGTTQVALPLGASAPKTQHVSGYLRKSGIYVRPYVRSSRR